MPGSAGRLPGSLSLHVARRSCTSTQCSSISSGANTSHRAMQKQISILAHFRRSEEHTSELQSLRHLVCLGPRGACLALFRYTSLAGAVHLRSAPRYAVEQILLIEQCKSKFPY